MSREGKTGAANQRPGQVWINTWPVGACVCVCMCVSEFIITACIHPFT